MILDKHVDLVNFLHIPRTAGRFVANLLTSNGYDYWDKFVGSGDRTIFFEGKELLHLTLSEEKQLAEKCNVELPEKRFTIIRNPVNKFISFSNIFESHIKLLNYKWKDMEDIKLFCEMMDTFGFISGGESGGMHLTFGLKNINSNAFIDQREWIDDTVNVWRFEDGLGKSFVNWLNNDVGLDSIKMTEVSYKKKSFDNHKTIFSKKMMWVLNKYFEDEIKHFNY